MHMLLDVQAAVERSWPHSRRRRVYIGAQGSPAGLLASECVRHRGLGWQYVSRRRQHMGHGMMTVHHIGFAAVVEHRKSHTESMRNVLVDEVMRYDLQ
jgi:hypothetical protein